MSFRIKGIGYSSPRDIEVLDISIGDKLLVDCVVSAISHNRHTSRALGQGYVGT